MCTHYWHKETHMNKWEYLAVEVHSNCVYQINGQKLANWDKGPHYADYFTLLGNERWELVGVASSGNVTSFVALFKRPK